MTRDDRHPVATEVAPSSALAAIPAAHEPGEALARLDDGVVLWHLNDSTPLRLTGADRIAFVHGQLSNDIRGLVDGGVTRALQLNHKGHVVAEMTVARRQDDLFVVVEGGAGSIVEASFRRHIVFDQVIIDNLDGVLVSLSLQGSATEDLLAKVGLAMPAAGRALETDLAGARVLLHASRRTLQAGCDLHLLASDLAGVAEALADAGVRAIPPAVAEVARVLAGLPTAANEGASGTLPQEAGLDGIVSYSKGCYLGQEIMARIEARGRLKRGLARLELTSWPSATERELQLKGRPAGRLGTVAVDPTGRVLALAVVRLDVQSAADLTVGTRAVRSLEWLR